MNKNLTDVIKKVYKETKEELLKTVQLIELVQCKKGEEQEDEEFKTEISKNNE